ncbi:GspH/FimT family pseudopilin [Variovorax sp. SG517]|uniref:GspH/FimT family pseudopilin n=1 Tax=unclassified Variovorax TaxID=663243 RepID=UPI00159D5530|nr:GspH/FimT family pseudopilin [Variovorax sp. SG517]NVM90737.1 type IV fimbrial biogenesis protein FimT [Variovorax sp. SG517]
MNQHGFCAFERGFTLVEMMAVIVLMAVMLGLALPAFNGLAERYRVEGMAKVLMASVSHARAEAVRRGKTVTIRQREGCEGRNWSCGWDTLAGSGNAAEILKRQDPDGRVVVEKSANGAVSFDAMGHSMGVASFRLRPSGSSGPSNAVAVCLALGGRVRLAKGGDAC